MNTKIEEIYVVNDGIAELVQVIETPISQENIETEITNKEDILLKIYAEIEELRSKLVTN